MKLDDLGRRAAAEVKEATRQARFSAPAPGSRRPLLARPAVAVGLVAVLLAVGLPLLLVLRPRGGEVLEPGPTTTISTTLAATTTLAPGAAPVASVGEVMPAIFTAINEKDDAAYLGVVADGARMLWYAVHGLEPDPAPPLLSLTSRRLFPSSLDQVMETGEVVVSGYATAAALRVVYPDPEPAWVGFDTCRAEPVAGGFRCAGAAWITAEESGGYAEADPAVVAGLLAAQAAAWAAGDVDGVLAGYWEYGKYIDGFTFEAVAPAGLAGFYAGMRLEFTGEPVISGPFFAVATRVTDLASGVATDGVSVYWVRDGEIALHVLTTTGA